MTWLADDRAVLAADRILDAAAGLFAEHGVTAVGMGDVARAAGCARATLYRYYADRDALRRAFVEREADRIGAQVAAAGGDAAASVLLAVRLVRAQPALAAWFTAESAGLGLEAALGLGGGDDARWLARCVVSLLAMPARDAADERRIVARYVVPGLGRG